MKNSKVKIVVIDSGVSEELAVQANISSRLNIQNDGGIIDDHGHGTAIVGMLNDYCSDSIDIIIIKVLDEKCSCSCNDLLNAIDIAIDLNPDVINLSLGTEDMKYEIAFQELCIRARKKEILLVTTNNGIEKCLPYMLSDAIKVKRDKRILTENLYSDGCAFYGIGVPHIVPWRNHKYIFVNRNSFVTPYFIKEFVVKKTKNTLLGNYEIVYNMQNEDREVDTCLIKYFGGEDFTYAEIIRRAISKQIGGFDERKSLFVQGLSMCNCIDLLLEVKSEARVNFPFTRFNLYDFEYISKVFEKISLLMSSDDSTNAHRE